MGYKSKEKSKRSGSLYLKLAIISLAGIISLCMKMSLEIRLGKAIHKEYVLNEKVVAIKAKILYQKSILANKKSNGKVYKEVQQTKLNLEDMKHVPILVPHNTN